MIVTSIQEEYVGFWVIYKYESGIGGQISVGLTNTPAITEYALLRSSLCDKWKLKTDSIFLVNLLSLTPNPFNCNTHDENSDTLILVEMPWNQWDTLASQMVKGSKAWTMVPCVLYLIIKVYKAPTNHLHCHILIHIIKHSLLLIPTVD